MTVNNTLYKLYTDLGLNSTKQNCHKYIELYYSILFPWKIRKKSLNLLEIGVRGGESINIWVNYFENATIYGIDIEEYNSNHDRVRFNLADAYADATVDSYQDNFFDYIIDDGPHTVESQLYAIKKWTEKLKPKGKLVIEDIGCTDGNTDSWGSSDEALNILLNNIDSNLYSHKVYDLRDAGQYDSIILELTKL